MRNKKKEIYEEKIQKAKYKKVLRIICAVFVLIAIVGALLGGIVIGSNMEAPLFGRGQEQTEEAAK